MDPHQKLKEMCPFCEHEVLEILWWPSHTAASISRSAIAKNTRWHKKAEGHELLSDKCPNCGKSAKEIERAWREGTQTNNIDKKKRLEELKELGFSGII
ncbi:MAG: hypothetical protein NT016_00545 [Candidatus Aenigmarchaeota archaeon]|nr:hypothetical protein [Candidatus Aenigmarchaeota archaeon]